MFRRSEKKIKAVFRMHFHATKVPELKAKKLMISLVPVNDGKSTSRLPKTPIIQGTCIWEKPVYETVKLVQETKTGRIREKFYYIIVSTGSSKSGFLGEVSIDFADLVDAHKPVNLSLPLQTSKSGTILHINVQKMNGEGSDSRHDDVSEATGDDESCYLEYENMSQSIRLKDHTMSPESDEFSGHDEHNGSLDDAESENNTFESRGLVKENPEEMLQMLRNQVKMFERKEQLTELEMQSLRKQMIKETRNGEQLAMQIVGLKEEKQGLEAELSSGNKQQGNDDIRGLLDSTKRELQLQKHSNKKLKLQLQEFEDSNSEYVLAMSDLTKKLEHKQAEAFQLSEQIKAMQSGLHDAASTSKKIDYQDEEAEILKQDMEKLNAEIELLKREKAKIRIEAEDLTEDYESLEAENKELYFKLEQKEREKMEIEKFCKVLSSEVKHLKLQVANLVAENEKRAIQHTESLNTISNLEDQVDSLQQELKKQEELFVQELETLNSVNVELEKKALRGDEALRKTRRSHADTVQKLQEELEQADSENLRRFEEYEKLAQQANDEASNLQKEHVILQQLLHETEEKLQVLRTRCNEGVAEETKKELGILKMEKEDLEKQLTSVKKEAIKLSEANASMKSEMNQKKEKEENMHLEVRKLRLKNNEVKNQLVELKSEKEALKKEISKLQDDSSKKEQKAAQKTSSHVDASLLSEVGSLKDKTRRMEQELKEMHERYSEISLKFAEVEGERQQLVMSLRNLKSGKKN